MIPFPFIYYNPIPLLPIQLALSTLLDGTNTEAIQQKGSLILVNTKTSCHYIGFFECSLYELHKYNNQILL